MAAHAYNSALRGWEAAYSKEKVPGQPESHSEALLTRGEPSKIQVQAVTPELCLNHVL